MSGDGIIHVYHLYTKNKSEKRLDEEIINRIRVMPFILDIVQGEKDYTKLIDVQKNNKKNYYEILGKGRVGDKEFAISVILTDANKDDVLYISIFSNEIKDNRKPRSSRPLRKSALLTKAVVIPCIEAVELPALFQPAWPTSTCDSCNYSNYIPESGESQALLKGKTEKNRKKPAYRMLEDVQDGLNSHFAVNVVYKTICRYLGLPEVFEDVLKAKIGSERIHKKMQQQLSAM